MLCSAAMYLSDRIEDLPVGDDVTMPKCAFAHIELLNALLAIALHSRSTSLIAPASAPPASAAYHPTKDPRPARFMQSVRDDNALPLHLHAFQHDTSASKSDCLSHRAALSWLQLRTDGNISSECAVSAMPNMPMAAVLQVQKLQLAAQLEG